MNRVTGFLALVFRREALRGTGNSQPPLRNRIRMLRRGTHETVVIGRVAGSIAALSRIREGLPCQSPS